MCIEKSNLSQLMFFFYLALIVVHFLTFFKLFISSKEKEKTQPKLELTSSGKICIFIQPHRLHSIDLDIFFSAIFY
jgi:hypothetical protein